jgi:hypothetical protein
LADKNRAKIKNAKREWQLMDITEEPRSKRADEEATTKPDVAYYYPAPYWAFEESDWVKSLLLFFDRVACFHENGCHPVTA